MKKEKKEKTFDTFLKKIVGIAMTHGIILSTTSYILSFLGKDTVETVSVAIISEILAPIVTYAVSKTVENALEKNEWSFVKPIKKDNESVVEPEEETE
jgi:ACR3 family arsenite efflux pump ArsB